MPWRRGTAVVGAVLDIADDSAFEDPVERWDVADGERGAAAAVDKLARVPAGRCRWRAWRGGRSRQTDPCTCPDVADGERGAAATIVLVVKLGRDCN